VAAAQIVFTLGALLPDLFLMSQPSEYVTMNGVRGIPAPTTWARSGYPFVVAEAGCDDPKSFEGQILCVDASYDWRGTVRLAPLPFAANVAVTAAPLAFLAARRGPRRPLLIVPALVLVDLVLRADGLAVDATTVARWPAAVAVVFAASLLWDRFTDPGRPPRPQRA
jgi:hypothetical protein